MSDSTGCDWCGCCDLRERVPRLGVAYRREPGGLVDADLDTLATALRVTTDDLLRDHPDRLPPRPEVGLAPRISDAEVLTLAVMQVLLGYSSERRWLRYARRHLLAMFRPCRDSPGTTNGCASWP